MSKYSALFESNSSDLVQSKYDALFKDEVLPTDTQSANKYDLLFEDNTPTTPQVEQTVSPDLKEKIDEAPWYESMLYEFNKFKFNALFGGAEGVGELASSVGELFGADIDNPLASEKPNLFRDAMGA